MCCVTEGSVKDNEMIFYLLSLPFGDVIHTKFIPIIVKDNKSVQCLSLWNNTWWYINILYKMYHILVVEQQGFLFLADEVPDNNPRKKMTFDDQRCKKLSFYCNGNKLGENLYTWYTSKTLNEIKIIPATVTNDSYPDSTILSYLFQIIFILIWRNVKFMIKSLSLLISFL